MKFLFIQKIIPIEFYDNQFLVKATLGHVLVWGMSTNPNNDGIFGGDWINFKTKVN